MYVMDIRVMSFPAILSKAATSTSALVSWYTHSESVWVPRAGRLGHGARVRVAPVPTPSATNGLIPHPLADAGQAGRRRRPGAVYWPLQT